MRRFHLVQIVVLVTQLTPEYPPDNPHFTAFARNTSPHFPFAFRSESVFNARLNLLNHG